MKTLAHNGAHAHRGDSGGFWAALLVVAVLVAAVWGAWKLGVIAGDQVEWRQSLRGVPSALRQGPNPHPAPFPTSRRPGVTPELRK
jgi:hypothetical protein